MSNPSSRCATLILGVPFFIGLLLTLIAGLGFIPAASVPWDQIIMGFGATLMAATLGLAVANVTHGSKRDIFIALVALLAVLFILSVLREAKPEYIAIGGVVLGVMLAEWLLSGALRRWCPSVVGGDKAP